MPEVLNQNPEAHGPPEKTTSRTIKAIIPDTSSSSIAIVILLMISILHDLQAPRLWEVWYKFIVIIIIMTMIIIIIGNARLIISAVGFWEDRGYIVGSPPAVPWTVSSLM